MTNTAFMRFHRALAACAIVSLASATAFAEGDVWLHTDVPNGKLSVGGVDEVATTYTPGVRVFAAIVTADSLPFSSFDFSGEEPGFRSAAGDLPTSQPIGLALGALKVWNGSSLDAAVGVDFHFDLSGGFSTQASGAFHEHPLRGLTSLSANPVADGVYVSSARASVAGLTTSDQFYFVLLKDDLIADEDDAEAVVGLMEDFENGGPAPVFAGKDFTFFKNATDFVAASVPEPSGMLLACSAVVGAAAARRRS